MCMCVCFVCVCVDSFWVSKHLKTKPEDKSTKIQMEMKTMTVRQKQSNEMNERTPLCAVSAFHHKSAQATTSEGLVMISWSTKCNHLVLFTYRCQRAGGREA